MIHFKPYFEVLKNLDFTKLWISQVASQLTNYLLSFAVLIRVFDVTNSSIAVSVIILAFGLATVFFGGLAGVYSDRFDRKWILTVINFAQALSILLFFLSDHLWFLALVIFIYSSLNQFYLPAEAPSIPNLVPHEQILIANSYFSFTGSASLIIGFAAAGPILSYFGPAGVYTTCIILLFIAGVSTLMLPSLKPQSKIRLTHSFEKIWLELKEGIKHFWENKYLHFPLLSLLTIQLFNGMVITLAPAYIKELLGLDLAKNTVLAVAPYGLGVITGALLLGFEGQHIKKRNLVFLGFLGTGISILSMTLVTRFDAGIVRLTYYSAMGFLLGIFSSHIFAPSHSLLQIHALETVRGRIYGALYVMLQIVATLPTIIAASLAEATSLVWVLTGMGALLILAGLVLRFQAVRAHA